MKRVMLDASEACCHPAHLQGCAKWMHCKKKFSTYPDNEQYICQPKAWMDEDAMNKWTDLVLIPWKDMKTPGVIPTLILDAYHMHMMGNIVNCIQLLGIEVIHIPAGCTYLCQPVDMGIIKSIKTDLRENWEDLMFDGGGIVNSVAKEPSRKMVAEWLLGFYKNIPSKIARNAWI
jgi:uncharacterized protein (DUF2237 family)